MKTRSVRLALALALANLGLALPAAAAKPPDGKAVYLAKCVTCHGKTGKPAPMFAKIGAKNLSDPEWQKSRTDEQVLSVITKGSEGTAMRSFAEELKPAEIEAVAKFVRTLDLSKGGGASK
jgi:mono/diheme cytochrome c family protein